MYNVMFEETRTVMYRKETEVEVKNCETCKYEKLEEVDYPCRLCYGCNKWTPKREVTISDNVMKIKIGGETVADFEIGTVKSITDTEKRIYDNMVNSMYGYTNVGLNVSILQIKDVIFNNPATIVFWVDGTKTVVKCQDGDIYDPEKGLAMAISKKALGNQGNYCEVFKKWLPEEVEVEVEVEELTFEGHLSKAINTLNELYSKPVTFTISKDAFDTITGDK